MLQITDTAATLSDFNAAVESAKLAALYNFAYGLSHEINNPLANITTRAQTLLADEKNPDRRRKLATIVQQAFRAHEMIADLMLFARPPAIRPEAVDLVALADTVLGEMQEQAREQNTDLIRVGDTGPLVAHVDRTQIAVALKAIIQNSLEAVRDGGSVEISVTASADCGLRIAESGQGEPSTQYSVLSTEGPAGDPGSTIYRLDTPVSPTLQSAIRIPHLLLTVTDTGPGIPATIRPHVFDPFFSGREAGRGLGLGLSKAWRIVEMHSGRMEVENVTESGAKFTIALPVG